MVDSFGLGIGDVSAILFAPAAVATPRIMALANAYLKKIPCQAALSLLDEGRGMIHDDELTERLT